MPTPPALLPIKPISELKPTRHAADRRGQLTAKIPNAAPAAGAAGAAPGSETPCAVTLEGPYCAAMALSCCRRQRDCRVIQEAARSANDGPQPVFTRPDADIAALCGLPSVR
jgi:hypothetical protein